MLKGWDLYLKSMAKSGNILQWLMACLHCCFKIIIMATMWELEIGELAEHLWERKLEWMLWYAAQIISPGPSSYLEEAISDDWCLHSGQPSFHSTRQFHGAISAWSSLWGELRPSVVSESQINFSFCPICFPYFLLDTVLSAFPNKFLHRNLYFRVCFQATWPKTEKAIAKFQVRNDEGVNQRTGRWGCKWKRKIPEIFKR